MDPSSAPARPPPMHTAAERHTSGRRCQTASTRDRGIVWVQPNQLLAVEVNFLQAKLQLVSIHGHHPNAERVGC